MSRNKATDWAAVKIAGVWRACKFGGAQWESRDYGVRFPSSDNGRRCAVRFAEGENRKLEEAQADDAEPPIAKKYVTSIFRPIMGERLNPSPRHFEGFPMREITLADGRKIDIFAAGRSRTQFSKILKDAVFNYCVVNQMSFEEALNRLLVDGLYSQGPEQFDQHLSAAEARRIDAETPPIRLSEEIYR